MSRQNSYTSFPVALDYGLPEMIVEDEGYVMVPRYWSRPAKYGNAHKGLHPEPKIKVRYSRRNKWGTNGTQDGSRNL